jgi:hypothetical protein
MPHRRKWLVALFLYGAAAQLLLLRLIAHWDSPANRSFIDAPLANAGLAALGGIGICLFFLPLVKAASDRGKRHALSILGRGAVCGIIATVLAEQVFLILLGAYLAIFIPSGAPLKMIGSVFVLWMIDIETYGLVYIIGWGPFDIVEGVLIAGVILLFTRASRNDNLRVLEGSRDK